MAVLYLSTVFLLCYFTVTFFVVGVSNTATTQHPQGYEFSPDCLDLQVMPGIMNLVLFLWMKLMP